MNKFKMKKKGIIWLLVLVFSLPMFVAYKLAQHPEWLGSINTTNYGQWVKNNVMWKAAVPNKRPWQLVYWVKDSCNKECLDSINQLAKIRLAMGRKLYQMNIWLMVPNHVQLSAKEIKNFQNQDILIAYADQKTQKQWSSFRDNPIVLFTPENKALLKYEANFNAKKMYHDLQLLIK